MKLIHVLAIIALLLVFAIFALHPSQGVLFFYSNFTHPLHGIAALFLLAAGIVGVGQIGLGFLERRWPAFGAWCNRVPVGVRSLLRTLYSLSAWGLIWAVWMFHMGINPLIAFSSLSMIIGLLMLVVFQLLVTGSGQFSPMPGRFPTVSFLSREELRRVAGSMRERENAERRDEVPDLEEMLSRRVLYTLPGMERVRVRRDLRFTQADDIELHADVYHPAGDDAAPAVICIAGSGPWEVLRNIKDSGVFRSYGELIAASGLAAVTFNHRSPEIGLGAVADDVDHLVAWIRENALSLRIDPDRIALWAFSGGPPFGWRTVLRLTPPYLRCLVAFYGVLDYRHMTDQLRFAADEVPATFSPAGLLATGPDRVPPLFVAKAGKDQAWINESIDRFVAEALRLNLHLDLMTHPTGQHAFDTLDDDPRTREIIRRTLEFLREHLSANR